jgi:tetratricopeptide (TPR) repeat protein
MDQVIYLGEQVMRRHRVKHASSRDEAEWLRLRADVLNMLRNVLAPMARQIEGEQVSPFAFAALHQRLGDLLRSLSQFEDARREYQQGFDRLDRVAHDQPDNDQARGNLAFMLTRLGEIDLDEGGDAARARDEFDTAWKIQEGLSLHPRSQYFSKTDNFRILSGIAIKQGNAELSLGHPALARDRFQKALGLRHAWAEVEPASDSAESYTSEAEFRLGVAYSHLGEWQIARRHLEEALRICTNLVEKHPRELNYKGDLASVYGEQGAALARSGQTDEAKRALNHSLHYAHAVLASDPEDGVQRLVTAGSSEELAALAHKRGKLADAERLWRSALEIRSELAKRETHNVSAQAALALALAHSGRRDEALKKAEQLLKTNANRPAVLLPIARCFAVCAAGVTAEGDRRRALALTLDALGSGIRSGYRDPIAIRTDPDFIPLLGETDFKDLVDRIKP